MNAVTTAEAQEDLGALIDRVVSDAEATIICGEGERKAVLVSLDEFNSWRETLYLLSSPANAERLRNSIAQARAGKVAQRELIEE